MPRNVFKGNISAKGKGLDNYPENINRKGRPLSLTKDLRDLLTKGEEILIWRHIKTLKTRISVDGEMEVAIPHTKPEAIVQRLLNHALSNSKNSMDAIRFLWEQIDGKAKQKIDMNISENIDYDFSLLTEKESATFYKLLDKITIKAAN